MKRTKLVLSMVLAAATMMSGRLALAQQSIDEVGSSSLSSGGSGKKPLPWRGTTLTFDQSVTTQTVGIGEDYQSSNPTYEWWFRFAPRYVLYENGTDTISAIAAFNVYHEFTNSDSTTYKNETQLGPTTLFFQYGRPLYKEGEWVTSLSVSPLRLTFPTDKASRLSGQILGLGGSVSVNQSIPINGRSASALNSARVGLMGIYNHPFTKATNPVNPDLKRYRQDLDGRTFESDVLRSGMLPNHQLNVAFTAGLNITPKFSLNGSYYIMNTWAYRPPGACVTPQGASTGPICLPTNEDAPNYRVATWFMASLDYDLFDELSLSLGYYNQANQIGPDGQRRSPFWSPYARFYFSITANLDAIYESLSGRNEVASKPNAQGAQQAKANLFAFE